MNKFSPVDLDPRWLLRRRRQGHQTNYNWTSRERWYPVGWKVNHRTIADIHSRLHYLACHAPKAVRQRWQPAYKLFCAQHFAQRGCASVRYLNNYTCHAWL